MPDAQGARASPASPVVQPEPPERAGPDAKTLAVSANVPKQLLDHFDQDR